MTLCFAYGSNLHIDQMKKRCPKAEPIGRLFLPAAQLVFRGVADVVWHPDEKCPGALWRISESDEAELDRYEGVANHLYEKRYIKVRVKGQPAEDCLLYTMLDDGVMPPSERYLATIEQGYRDFGLPLSYLNRAVARSWEDKYRTPHLNWRHERRGRPRLARKVGDMVQLRKRA